MIGETSYGCQANLEKYEASIMKGEGRTSQETGRQRASFDKLRTSRARG